MLQNKLMTFYFELKQQVRGMDNISLTESLQDFSCVPFIPVR